MLFGRILAPLTLLACLSAAPARAQDAAPTPTPLPPTTMTQERLVNPTGLSEPPKLGWHTDGIGALRGDFDLSFGVKFWPGRFDFRNLIFGGTVELAPGIRVRGQFRRREGEKQAFQIDADEIYLEGYQKYRARNWQAGADLRIGHVRYLHFPYPDAISQFDIPAGIDDLYGRSETDYRSVVFQTEAALNSGFGAHFGGELRGLDDSDPSGRILETYGFYRGDFGRGWHLEGRGGLLAPRTLPVGRNATAGGALYLGKQIGEFNVGLLYENKREDGEYSGIMIQFRPGPVTRALGRYTVDYSRRPEGFTAQIPLWHGRLNESRFVRPDDILVGEVRAVRIRTVFLQGFQRNQYEHHLESWGETTDSKLHCVVTEEPWYLEAEALVSHHLIPDASWERDRMGPGQYVQRVTYRYYRPKPRPDNRA